MSEVAITRCDGPGCGKTKGTANRWICVTVWRKNGNPVALLLDTTNEYSKQTWLEAVASYCESLDFCSDACFQPLLAKIVAGVRGGRVEEVVEGKAKVVKSMSPYTCPLCLELTAPYAGAVCDDCVHSA